MTPTQTKDVVSTVQALWPRCKWTADEQDVFEERVRRLNIEPDQAEAAIRNLKATSDKFPQIATLLKALENARNRPTVQADAPRPPTTRLSEMARRNGLNANGDRVQIVVADWYGKAKAAKRTRGYIPETHFEIFKAEMIELANATAQEIDEHWYAVVEYGEQFEPFPDAGKYSPETIRAQVQAMGKIGEREKAKKEQAA